MKCSDVEQQFYPMQRKQIRKIYNSFESNSTSIYIYIYIYIYITLSLSLSIYIYIYLERRLYHLNYYSNMLTNSISEKHPRCIWLGYKTSVRNKILVTSICTTLTPPTKFTYLMPCDKQNKITGDYANYRFCFRIPSNRLFPVNEYLQVSMGLMLELPSFILDLTPRNVGLMSTLSLDGSSLQLHNYIYIYICVCMCVCMCVCEDTCQYIHKHTCICTCELQDIHKHINIQ